MQRLAKRFYSALENELKQISVNGLSSAEQSKASILLCKKAMVKLKAFISGYVFKSIEEEIYFFKSVKPLFYSEYIYFISVFNFLMKRPKGAQNHLKNYIFNELSDLKRYFDQNAAFYQYYRSGSTQMDGDYYTRGGFQIFTELEKFEEDEVYSTSHDYKLSHIMANEKYQEFLNFELRKTSSQEGFSADPLLELPLTWTSGKTDLIELSYALVSAGVFNNGNTDIKTAVDFFQKAFHIELGQYYHKYSDITQRKKQRTVFLDKLRIALLRKIDQKLDEDGSLQ